MLIASEINLKQYAQPQGNEMDTDKMIPIDFSRNITPFVVGDKIWNSDSMKEFVVSSGQLDGLTTQRHEELTHLYVISFADRPNTGKQPVGDGVSIDAFYDGSWFAEVSDTCTWGCKGKLEIKSWKPNYAVMLKQWQAGQGNKEQAHHIALQEGDTVSVSFEGMPHAIHQKWDIVPVGDGIGKGEVAHSDGGLKLVKAEDKLAFTQAQADAGELPMVGSECLVLGKDGDGNYLDCEIILHRTILGFKKVAVFTIKDYDGLAHYYSHCTANFFKPIKTDEDELRSALMDILDGISFRCDAEALMTSDKIEIKLKG